MALPLATRMRILRARHGTDRSAARAFPDLSVPSTRTQCTNSTAPAVGAKRAAIEGAKQFPVAHLHKQGAQLITPDAIKHDLMWYGGRKS